MARLRKLPSRDVVGGLVLVLLGVAVAGYGYANYRLGVLRSIGPGFMPLWLGLVLAGTGAAIAALAPRWVEEVEVPDLRPVAMLVTGILMFAGTMPFFGLVPAVVLLTISVALAETGRSLKSLTGLVIAGLLLSVGIFRYALGIRLPLVAWPF